MIALGQKGAFAEHLAVAFLLRQGFEVYRNVSMHGPIDMIAMRGTETLRLDVKTRRGAGLYGATEKQRELGVKLLLVEPETGECVIVDPAPARQPLKCATCEKLFYPRIERQIYCHRRCAAQAAYGRDERRLQYARDRRSEVRAKAGLPPPKLRNRYRNKKRAAP